MWQQQLRRFLHQASKKAADFSAPQVPLASQIAVGLGAASFWRGAWYILDDHLFPENAVHSAAASLGLGTLGLALTQNTHIISDSVKLGECMKTRNKISIPLLSKQLRRFGGLYCLTLSVVLIWRGTWMMWDVGYEYFHNDANFNVKSNDPGHMTRSGFASHIIGIGGLLCIGRFRSVLAPPASISILKDSFSVRTVFKKQVKAVADRFF